MQATAPKLTQGLWPRLTAAKIGARRARNAAGKARRRGLDMIKVDMTGRSVQTVAKTTARRNRAGAAAAPYASHDASEPGG